MSHDARSQKEQLLDFSIARSQAGNPTHGGAPMTETERAMTPEDLTRLFVERANAGDAAGLAALYAEDAVMAFPPGQTTVGRAAIEALWTGCSAPGRTSSWRPRCPPWSAGTSR